MTFTLPIKHLAAPLDEDQLRYALRMVCAGGGGSLNPMIVDGLTSLGLIRVGTNGKGRSEATLTLQGNAALTKLGGPFA